MSDALDIIIKKMSIFGEKISEKSNFYFKKAIHQSEKYADKGILQIENEKLKWKLKKAYIDLGKYIYNSNKLKNTIDYSDDEEFILLLDKVERIKNLINHNNKQ